jgi:hypothetical protein
MVRFVWRDVEKRKEAYIAEWSCKTPVRLVTELRDLTTPSHSRIRLVMLVRLSRESTSA